MLKKKWKCRPKYIRKFSQKLILNDWRDTGAELSGNREKQVVHKARDHDAKQSIWIKVVSYVTISGSGFISVPRFYQNSEGLWEFRPIECIGTSTDSYIWSIENYRPKTIPDICQERRERRAVSVNFLAECKKIPEKKTRKLLLWAPFIS